MTRLKVLLNAASEVYPRSAAMAATVRMETVRGQAAVEQLAHETLVTYEDGTPKTRHVTTNILVEVDEEAGHATARSYFTVFQALPDFPLQPVAIGRYRDQFTRTDGGWHFAERHVLLDFQGDVSHHVLPRT